MYTRGRSSWTTLELKSDFLTSQSDNLGSLEGTSVFTSLPGQTNPGPLPRDPIVFYISSHKKHFIHTAC